ncbi:MAG: hypothetical protein ACC707_08985 [Thiohalomonadales bacterium]
MQRSPGNGSITLQDETGGGTGFGSTGGMQGSPGNLGSTIPQGGVCTGGGTGAGSTGMQGSPGMRKTTLHGNRGGGTGSVGGMQGSPGKGSIKLQGEIGGGTGVGSTGGMQGTLGEFGSIITPHGSSGKQGGAPSTGRPTHSGGFAGKTQLPGS